MMLRHCSIAVVTLSVMLQHFSVDVVTLHFCLPFYAFLLIFAFFLKFLKNTNMGEDSLILH